MLNIRKIGVIGRTYRHLNRYRQILTVFIKYGFGDLLDLLNLDQYLEIGLQVISRKRRDKVEKLSRAQRLRMAFEELGPTYIKLGQAISTRSDLVPPEFIAEMSKLQDSVSPRPFSDIQSIIESDLKAPVETLFDDIEQAPLASASIGQVHKARLADGESVAVKVQHPGIRKIIEVDLEIILHLVTLMERHIEGMALHRPVRIVEEFAETMEKELDYTIEASSMERFADNFSNDPTVHVPRVFRETTSTRVLTMEYVSGIKVSQVDTLKQNALDLKVITSRGANLFLKQVFHHGFFHADPHPGNIFILPGNVICFLDFGMMGCVNRKTREDFVDLIDSLVNRDETKATQVLLKLTDWEEEPDIRALEIAVADIMGTHLYKPLKDIQISRLVQLMFELVSRHRLRIPPNLFLMIKAFSTIEGVGVMLDPDFDMINQATPFLKQIKLSKLNPRRIAEDMAAMASQSVEFARQFPKDMLEITRLLRAHELMFKFENQGLDTMLGTYDQISNRLSFSIIIAALIIGSALIVISEIPPLFFGISLIGLILFLAAAVMGIWLLVAILKKGRL